MNEFVSVFAHGAAKRTGIKCGFAGQRQQSAHVHADQFAGGHANHRGQRAVHAQNFVILIMHDDEVGNGVKDFQPVAVRLFDASKEAGIFQCHGGVSGNGIEQVAIFDGERTVASRQAKQTGEISIGTGKPNHHQVAPAQGRGQLRTEQFGGSARNNRFSSLRSEF